jgi:L-ascorbate 6-phosphate lactonase
VPLQAQLRCDSTETLANNKGKESHRSPTPVERLLMNSGSKIETAPSFLYDYGMNDPYDRAAQIKLIVPQLLDSRSYMESIRQCRVPTDSLAVWYLGQNGFILKDSAELVIGIDLYLSNSCASSFGHLPFRLDRQLPVFIEPEDLDIDIFITTHSHGDHADPETIRRLDKTKSTRFFGPFDSMRIYAECGVRLSSCRLLHPGETVTVASSTQIQATFALPTDASDLNHSGVLVSFSNDIRFYNTGDTAYSERLADLLPADVDICAICVNGGFHNLSAVQAAGIVKAIRARVAVPCHYDMMVCNVGSPEMLRVALDLLNSDAEFCPMKYYEPWFYKRQ